MHLAPWVLLALAKTPGTARVKIKGNIRVKADISKE